MPLREFVRDEFELAGLTCLVIAGNYPYTQGLWIRMLMELPSVEP